MYKEIIRLLNEILEKPPSPPTYDPNYISPNLSPGPSPNRNPSPNLSPMNEEIIALLKELSDKPVMCSLNYDGRGDRGSRFNFTMAFQ